MIATFLFKCRQCGQIQRGSSMGTDDEIQANARRLLVEAMMGIVKDAMAPEMLELHTCGPGKCGIADLIGFESEVRQ